jgi:hypothetical protein
MNLTKLRAQASQASVASPSASSGTTFAYHPSATAPYTSYVLGAWNTNGTGSNSAARGYESPIACVNENFTVQWSNGGNLSAEARTRARRLLSHESDQTPREACCG